MQKIAVFNAHVNEACEQTGRSRLDLLRELRKAGISGLEVDIADVTDVAALKAELKAVDMTISSLCGTYHFEETGRADLQLVAVADALEVEQIMPVPGFFTERIPLEQARANCLKALTELVVAATEKKIKVSVEDYDAATSVVMDSEAMRWFGDRIEKLYYTFDTGNFLYSGEDALAAFANLEDKVIHFHAKDRSLTKIVGTGSKETLDGKTLYATAVGSGVIPLDELLQKLAAQNYHGWITIEHFGAKDQLQSMLDSVAWLKSRSL